MVWYMNSLTIFQLEMSSFQWLKITLIPKNSVQEPFIFSNGFFAGLIFRGAYFRKGLFLEGILRFKMGCA